MTEADIEATQAPLMDHLIELRAQLIKALLAFVVFVHHLLRLRQKYLQHSAATLSACCRARRAADLYGAAGIFLHADQSSDFRGGFSSPVPSSFAQLYAFVAPGLYKKERKAFAPYLFATPVFFAIGGLLVYFVVMPNLLSFFIGMQQAKQPRPRSLRAVAAGQRISVAGDDADLRLRDFLSTAGGSHAARPRRHR